MLNNKANARGIKSIIVLFLAFLLFGVLIFCIALFLFSLSEKTGFFDAIKKSPIMFVLTSLLCVIFAALFSVFFTKPLRILDKKINKVGEKANVGELPEIGYSETKNLVRFFNTQIVNSNKDINRRRTFVSDVSHELRTPLASIKVLAESLLAENNVPEEVYRDFMRDINAEAERANKIVNSLLALVKLEAGERTLNIEEVSINRLIEDIMKEHALNAAKAGVELMFESRREIIAEADEARVIMLFSNLIDNAIKYNNEGGYVKVITNADFKFFTVKVMDNGIGIPEESLNYIYDRFYRVDKDRSRESGGNGLGLSIVYETVQLLKGTVEVESKINSGTIFTVRIPLKHPVSAE